MKKGLTIFVIFILLASGMWVTLDRHYCGGRLADVNLSITGKMASCGMEKSESTLPFGTSIDKKCCEDKITLLNISSKYIPEYFEVTHPFSFNLPDAVCQSTDIICQFKNKSLLYSTLPPGNNYAYRLTQPELCIFRN
jgi:hypothetical protein